MFDLNHTIDNWRSAFSQSGECSKEDVQELESHLREQVAALTKSGLSEQEAFLVSVSRLGIPNEVCAEYAKANPVQMWRHRLYWMAAGVFCWIAITCLQSPIAWSLTSLAWLLGVRGGMMLGVSYGLVSLALILTILWCVRALYTHGVTHVGHSRLATLTATRSRRIACVIGIVGGGILGRFARMWALSHMAKAFAREPMTLAYMEASQVLVNAILSILVIAFVVSQYRTLSQPLMSMAHPQR